MGKKSVRLRKVLFIQAHCPFTTGVREKKIVIFIFNNFTCLKKAVESKHGLSFLYFMYLSVRINCNFEG